MNKKVFWVAPFVFFSLIIAIWTGLLRMGWGMPFTIALVHHGALMVGSFLGTVIILERVVALKIKWLYILPVISGASGILFLMDNSRIAVLLLMIASLGLMALYIIIISKYKHYYFYVMLFGAFCWFVGNYYLFQQTLYAMSVNWWMAFILFTVVGERLELGKFMPPRKLKLPLFWIAVSIVFLGLVLPYHGIGSVTTGIGFMAISLWLFRYDIIRKSIKVKGIHRYTAVMLGFGYVWLFITGALFIVNDLSVFHYDAVVHTFFIGFTFSMIFAHGPIIFPGVAGFPFKPFHPVLYWLGGLLQLSLLVRISADLLNHVILRKSAGMINGITILLFFVTLIILIVIEHKKWKPFHNK